MRGRPRLTPGSGPRPATSFFDHNYDDGNYDGFSDPWEEEIIQEGTEEWQRASALMDSVRANWPTGWRKTCPSHFGQMLDFILPRLPEQQPDTGGKR